MDEQVRMLASALEEMLRLADMGFEEAMAEPEENGCYAAYTKAKAVLTAYRASETAKVGEGEDSESAPGQEARPPFAVAGVAEKLPRLDGDWFDEVEDFLDDYSDAEIIDGQTHPNKPMRLLCQLREAAGR
jgi:hypothetical protein